VKRSYPERDTSTQKKAPRCCCWMCVCVCVTLAGSFLFFFLYGRWRHHHHLYDGSLFSSSFFLLSLFIFQALPFAKESTTMLYRVITAAEMDAITFNMYTVVLFYLPFVFLLLLFFCFLRVVYFLVCLASPLRARDLKWSLWPVCHFIAHRFVCLSFVFFLLFLRSCRALKITAARQVSYGV
jgi:hypothetical protein